MTEENNPSTGDFGHVREGQIRVRVSSPWSADCFCVALKLRRVLTPLKGRRKRRGRGRRKREVGEGEEYATDSLSGPLQEMSAASWKSAHSTDQGSRFRRNGATPMIGNSQNSNHSLRSLIRWKRLKKKTVKRQRAGAHFLSYKIVVIANITEDHVKPFTWLISFSSQNCFMR